MAYFLAPSADARPQFFTSQGAVLAGGFLYWYAAGTTTPQDTFTDSTGAVANANPIVLNSAGRPATGIYLTEGTSYKLICKDSAGNTIFTQDNIVGITTALTNNEWSSSGLTATYISATQFSVPGDQTTDFHKRRRLKVIDAGGTKYGTITASAFTTLTTVTVEIDAGGSLSNPLTSVSWSIITAVNPSIDADMVHRKSSDTVASAATTDIWSIQGDYVHITGSTGPITSFGTAPYAGAMRTLIFDSTPTITYNATTLQIPGAASITAAAGDRAIVRADTTANMIVVDFIRAAVIPSMVLLSTGTASASATLDFTNLTGYEAYRFILSNIVPATDAATLQLSVSQDNGGTWKNAANSYGVQRYLMNWSAASSAAGVAGTGTIITICNGIDNSAGNGLSGIVEAIALNGSGRKYFNLHVTYFDSAGAVYVTEIGGGEYILDATACNGIRFNFSGGNISTGTIRCYGIRG